MNLQVYFKTYVFFFFLEAMQICTASNCSMRLNVRVCSQVVVFQ